MCGICGFVDKKSKDEKKKVIKAMADRIIHRGPDSDGYFIDDKVALGFRRLSIIDLNGGDQPLFNEKKDVVVFLNGEIYNFRELRSELEEKGHVFKTKSDTEVIAHGYEEYGTDIFNKQVCLLLLSMILKKMNYMVQEIILVLNLFITIMMVIHLCLDLKLNLF